VPTFDDGVAFGIQRCWGTMKAFFDLLVNQLDEMSPFGTNLSDHFLNHFWVHLEKTCSEALTLFEDFEVSTRHGPEYDEQLDVLRDLVGRICSGHGRFQIQLKVHDWLSDANVQFADDIGRHNDAFSHGTATGGSRRVMVTMSWLLSVLKSIQQDWGRILLSGQHQKLMISQKELAAETVVAVRTNIGTQTGKKTRPAGADNSPLAFEAFNKSLPPQRCHVNWALSCIEMNWDYIEHSVRYRFMEQVGCNTRIDLVIQALEDIAPLNWAMLKEHDELFVTPTSYDHSRVHDCPILLWLKPVMAKPQSDPRSRSPRGHRPQSALWSSG
jgi:hypothetical protein